MPKISRKFRFMLSSNGGDPYRLNGSLSRQGSCGTIGIEEREKTNLQILVFNTKTKVCRLSFYKVLFHSPINCDGQPAATLRSSL